MLDIRRQERGRTIDAGSEDAVEVVRPTPVVNAAPYCRSAGGLRGHGRAGTPDAIHRILARIRILLYLEQYIHKTLVERRGIALSWWTDEGNGFRHRSSCSWQRSCGRYYVGPRRTTVRVHIQPCGRAGTICTEV